MKEINSMKMEFPSLSANEGLSRGAVSVFASQLDLTVSELGDIKTAVSEAVTNCIVHAYPETIGIITLKARILEREIIEITIKDRGKGIENIDKAREPLFTTGGDDRSGMGFTIMESFMDSLKIRSKPGKGTVVTMRRKIAKRALR